MADVGAAAGERAGAGGDPPAPRSTSQMIDDCFRHQHPEAYGRVPVPHAAVPWELECGRDHMVGSPTRAVAEEPMGHPTAVPLDAG